MIVPNYAMLHGREKGDPECFRPARWMPLATALGCAGNATEWLVLAHGLTYRMFHVCFESFLTFSKAGICYGRDEKTRMKTVSSTCCHRLPPPSVSIIFMAMIIRNFDLSATKLPPQSVGWSVAAQSAAAGLG